MIKKNIILGQNVDIDETTSINNVNIGDNVRIAKYCSIFGGDANVLRIGANSYVGMNTVLNGYAALLTIGKNVSIAQNVNIMVDSGPNASPRLQRIFPLEKGPVTIGDNSWIGASSIIINGVSIGKFCVVAASSFVTKSFEDYSIIGGVPAKLLRKMTFQEIEEIERL